MGKKSKESLEISGYNVYKANYSESIADGSAIAIKYNIPHKLYDDFDFDVLAVEIQTHLGSIIISTMYLPPRKPFLPFADMHRPLINIIQTYIIDFNGRHRHLGNGTNNRV